MNIYLAEIVGTAILVLLGDGVVADVALKKSKANNGGWIVVAAGWGMAVAMAVYAVGRISGAHINPAVTIGLASIGEFPWDQVPGYIAAQLLGGVIGGILVWAAFFEQFRATEDQGAKLAVFATSPEVRSTVPNLVTEIIGTAMLVFGVLVLVSIANGVEPVAGNEAMMSAFGSWMTPLLVGLLVFSIGLSLGGPTGYAINPARDLGPRIVHAILPIAGKGDSDWSYSWIPIAGPIVGGCAGAILFRAVGL